MRSMCGRAGNARPAADGLFLLVIMAAMVWVSLAQHLVIPAQGQAGFTVGGKAQVQLNQVLRHIPRPLHQQQVPPGGGRLCGQRFGNIQQNARYADVILRVGRGSWPCSRSGHPAPGGTGTEPPAQSRWSAPRPCQQTYSPYPCSCNAPAWGAMRRAKFWCKGSARASPCTNQVWPAALHPQHTHGLYQICSRHQRPFRLPFSCTVR